VGFLLTMITTATIRPTAKTTHPAAIPAIAAVDNARPSEDAVWSVAKAWGVG